MGLLGDGTICTKVVDVGLSQRLYRDQKILNRLHLHCPEPLDTHAQKTEEWWWSIYLQ